MAILKFLCEVEDFDLMDASVHTDASYIDTTRVEYGFSYSTGRGLSASWPAPVGSEVWLHWRHGQTTTSGVWDDFGVQLFLDADGNQVMRMDITDGVVRWNINGDTTAVASYAATAGSSLTYDVQFIKNGTTSLTMNVWVNGVQRVTSLSVANARDNGVPVCFHMTFTDILSQGTIVWSEGVVADEDTRGWRLRQHRTTAYSTFDEWDGSADVPAGDVRKSTGITTNTNDDRVSYDLSNLADIPTLATIDRVCVQSTLIRGSAGLANFNHFFRYDTGPTVIHDANVAVGTTLQEFISEYPTSPDTGVAWTDTEMQLLQVGVRGRT